MAQLYFGATNPTFAKDSVFEVGLFLDTSGEQIAAVESVLSLSPGLEILDVVSSNSILSLWLEQPQFKNQSAYFSGMIPGGFSGDRGEIVRLLVRANEAGSQILATDRTRILLNDGQGTEASLIPAPLTLEISSEGTPTIFTPPEDTQPPEAFVPLLVNQPEFGGWAVVFDTQDKGSGIDHYEVREGLDTWSLATSPYTLSNQRGKHKLSVKAVDKSGNERVAEVANYQLTPWYSSGYFWGILSTVILGVCLAIFWRWLWRRATPRRKRR